MFLINAIIQTQFGVGLFYILCCRMHKLSNTHAIIFSKLPWEKAIAIFYQNAKICQTEMQYIDDFINSDTRNVSLQAHSKQFTLNIYNGKCAY